MNVSIVLNTAITNNTLSFVIIYKGVNYALCKGIQNPAD